MQTMQNQNQQADGGIQFLGEQHNAKIKVIGVGGCGGNIVNYLSARNVSGVEYAAVNTDAQALGMLADEVERVQIGQTVTGGLGAGAKPEVAAAAAEEEEHRLRELFGGYDMVFVAAGMGKGTGTGAAPVVARIAREAGALTVAVVTRPFNFERRASQAEGGILETTKYVDSLIVAPNEKLFEVLGDKTTLKTALAAANDILYNAVCGISEIITKPGMMNVDFNDVRSVMSAQGKAVIGSAAADGEARAENAAYAALRCPLMEDVDLSNATHVLVNVTGHEDKTELGEVSRVQDIIGEHVPGCESEQFTGLVYDNAMGDSLRVTIIVTGVRDVFSAAAAEKPAPSLDVVRGEVRDPSFTSGRGRRQMEDILEAAGGDETKVPTILRRQRH